MNANRARPLHLTTTHVRSVHEIRAAAHGHHPDVVCRRCRTVRRRTRAFEGVRLGARLAPGLALVLAGFAVKDTHPIAALVVIVIAALLLLRATDA